MTHRHLGDVVTSLRFKLSLRPSCRDRKMVDLAFIMRDARSCCSWKYRLCCRVSRVQSTASLSHPSSHWFDMSRLRWRWVRVLDAVLCVTTWDSESWQEVIVDIRDLRNRIYQLADLEPRGIHVQKWSDLSAKRTKNEMTSSISRGLRWLPVLNFPPIALNPAHLDFSSGLTEVDWCSSSSALPTEINLHPSIQISVAEATIFF